MIEGKKGRRRMRNRKMDGATALPFHKQFNLYIEKGFLMHNDV